MFQVPDKGRDGLGWVDAVLYQWDWDHEGIVDEVLGTLNLLQMILGVIEGQIRGGWYFGPLRDRLYSTPAPAPGAGEDL